MFLNMNNNASYNFLAPNIAADADKKVEVVFPTHESQALAAAATIAVNINRQVTFVDLGELGANATLNATIAGHVQRGAILNVKAASDATARSLTFGTGFTAPVVSGTISKTKVVTLIYNGTTFLPVAAAVQID